MENLNAVNMVDVYNFLDNLRESGRINMFAAPSAIQDAYGYDSATARKLFLDWTKQFGGRK